MATMDAEIQDALYNGASTGFDFVSSSPKTRIPSDAAIERFRCQLMGFLRDLPDDMTVSELLEEIAG